MSEQCIHAATWYFSELWLWNSVLYW